MPVRDAVFWSTPDIPRRIAGNKPPIPGKDGIWLGDTGDLLKSRAAESLADLGEGGALGIREPHTGWKMSSEDAILRCQVLILEQELLIDQAGDVGQQASPFVVCHEEHPS